MSFCNWRKKNVIRSLASGPSDYKNGLDLKKNFYLSRPITRTTQIRF